MAIPSGSSELRSDSSSSTDALSIQEGKKFQEAVLISLRHDSSQEASIVEHSDLIVTYPDFRESEKSWHHNLYSDHRRFYIRGVHQKMNNTSKNQLRNPNINTVRKGKTLMQRKVSRPHRASRLNTPTTLAVRQLCVLAADLLGRGHG